MSLPDLQFPIRFIDLFAGVGGFHYGLDRVGAFSGTTTDQKVNSSPERSPDHINEPSQVGGQPAFTCVYSNEWDKYANSVYRRHYHECDNRDIRTVQPEEIPDFDLLCGGFPCQAFSIAGNRRGFADTRGTLFFEIARILKAKQPRFILLENVKGLLSHDNGTTVKVIFATLDELGYDIEWQVVNSKNFGVPQNRERIIIVGHLRGTRIGQIFPIEGTGGKTLNYIGAIMSTNNQKWLEDGKQLSRNFPQGQRVYGDDGVGTTLAAQAGGLGAKTGLYAVTRGRSTENWKESDVAPTVRNGDKQDVRAVITPDRLNKRQNGRRFKEVGEPSFTLTGQDIHGVMIQQVHELAKQSRTEGVGVTFEENGDLRAHRLDEKKSGISELAINFEDNLSNTVTSAHAPKVYTNDDLRIRRLTPVECERLQGFPNLLYWTDMTRDELIALALATNIITVDIKNGEVYVIRGPGGVQISPRKCGTNCNGYLVINLSAGGEKKQIKLHRLVWIAANGIPNEGMVVCHKNNNKQDNRIENLYLATPKQNTSDAAHDGLLNGRGAKIDFEIAQGIRMDYETEKYTMRQLAIKYKISKSRIHQIIHMQGWTELGVNGEPISNNQRYKMMGNAVTTKVIEAVGLKFLQSL